MSGTSAQLETYGAWMRGTALPLWAEAGYATAEGRFHERLDGAAKPLAVPHRAMVQARQIYVFAHAAVLGWFPGGALARAALESLVRDFREEHDGEASFAFSIDARGTIVAPVRDAYTHAFILFALAWMHRLTGEAGLLALADRVTRFIEARLLDPVHGGLFDSVPIMARDKRQNPVMHLLEAYLALEEAAPGRGYIERAGVLVALFRERLFRDPPGILPEYFADDWSEPADPAMRGVWEPGHHFEWAWLMSEYDRLSGADHRAAGDLLHAMARQHGIAPGGLIHDELSAGGIATKRSTRLWPHTEAIKAALVRRDGGGAGFADEMAGALLRRFLDRPFPGGWTDHLDPDGQPLVEYVPASSLYHLFVAAAEAAKRSQDQGATPAAEPRPLG